MTGPEVWPSWALPLIEEEAAKLEQFGFRYAADVVTTRDDLGEGQEDAARMMFHPEERTYASIGLADIPDPVGVLRVTFETIFEDGTALDTVNGLQHATIFTADPRLTVHDVYSPTLEGQWRAHQEKLREKSARPREETIEEHLGFLDEFEELLIQGLVQTQRLAPDDADPKKYVLTFKEGLKFTKKILQGGPKIAAMVRARNTPEPELPAELEIRAYQRLRLLQKARSRRGVYAWLLAATGAIFLLSILPFFDPLMVAILAGVVLFHELGHFLAMRALGYEDTSIFFVPFFGAATIGRKERRTLNDRMIVLLAGPVPGLIAGTTLLIAAEHFHWPDWLNLTALVLLAVNALNLLPIGPLDGGKIVHALIFARHRYADAAFEILAFAALLGAGLWSNDPLLIAVGVIVGIALPNALRLAFLETKARSLAPETSDTAPLVVNVTRIAGKGRPLIRRLMLARSLEHRLGEPPGGWALSVAWLCVYAGSLAIASLPIWVAPRALHVVAASVAQSAEQSVDRRGCSCAAVRQVPRDR